jgi:hypothetical protein
MARPLARRAHAGLPEWIRPQLTEFVDVAPQGDQWLHEFEFDGYRMIWKVPAESLQPGHTLSQEFHRPPAVRSPWSC